MRSHLRFGRFLTSSFRKTAKRKQDLLVEQVYIAMQVETEGYRQRKGEEHENENLDPFAEKEKEFEGENPMPFVELIGFLFNFLLALSLTPLWLCGATFLFLTVVGHPVGKQCLNVVYYLLVPNSNKHIHLGNASINDLEGSNMIVYIIWILIAGIGLGFAHLGIGLLFYITVIYQDYATIHFRACRFAFFPIGGRIVDKREKKP